MANVFVPNGAQILLRDQFLASALLSVPFAQRATIMFLDYGHFTDSFTHPMVAPMVQIFAIGTHWRHMKTRGTRVIWDAIALGELCWLGVESSSNEARERFLLAIRYYIAKSVDDQIATIAGGAGEVDQNEEGQEGGNPADVVILDENSAAFINAIENTRIITINRMALPINFNQAYDFAIMEANRISVGMFLSNSTYLATSAIVALVKKGNMSEQFLQKVQTSMLAEVGNCPLYIDPMRNFYNWYISTRLTAATARDLFQRLENLLPAHALRLILTVQQAAGAGMTNYNLINEALAAFSDFTWSIVEMTSRGQFEAFRLATITINGDQYFGYNRDLGEAKSTKYAVLAWTARGLLIMSGTQPALARYGAPWRANAYPRIARAIELFLAQENPLDEEGNPRNRDHVFHAQAQAHLAALRTYHVQAAGRFDNNAANYQPPALIPALPFPNDL